MIKKIWNSYIEWLLSYIHRDKEYKWRLTFMEISYILIAFVICYIVFYFLIGTEFVFGIFVASIGYGRLIFDRIMIFNDKEYPYDKRYTPFLRFISLTSVGVVTAILTFMLIKDAHENNTDVQKLIERNYSDAKVEDNGSETSSSNNIYNFNNKLPMKIKLGNE
ncbi:hypothetical protein [Arcobacter sp. FWKO B]|uniref:hypothetical protein n=1 Tax=Arcobacter sp. FWKO B TaxID=2593672 RepID=UPI0018A63280|nr:hypothetical protein [Arcobacter sp. FWKO B]QOG12850.1 hypothetical protein FWKOB_09160 [Arcobacter sp. FWKO B]